MEQTILGLIIGILIFEFALERFLDYLNTTRWSDQLPDEVKDIYDEEKYRRQQAYEKVNHRFSMISSSFTFILVLLMFLLAGFALVNSWATQISQSPIGSALIFFGILLLAADLLASRSLFTTPL
jgi:STE24 endopeptidase